MSGGEVSRDRLDHGFYSLPLYSFVLFVFLISAQIVHQTSGSFNAKISMKCSSHKNN